MTRSIKWVAFSLVAIALALNTAYGASPPPMTAGEGQAQGEADKRTPEQKMAARHPQKVRVGDLIGLAIQDYGDRPLGYVDDVVRTPEGKITLVMSERGWFGRSGRPVSIPIETVVILARHLNLLDIPREQVATLPTWSATGSQSINRNEIIRIAIGRR